MATLKSAKEFFHLSSGANDDNFNAYNYMILTARAKPEAKEKVPAIVHFDGTCRVQIVNEESDPFTFQYLCAMGRYIGAEISVNTSLNVGSPIVQTPEQALGTLRKSGGMHGIIMIGAEGTISLVWHNIKTEHKDCGETLKRWMSEKNILAQTVP